MKRKRLSSDDDDSFDFPLLPDSVMVSNGDPVDPLGPNTDDSKDGENTSDGPSNSQQSSEDSQSLQYFLPKELFEIENGHESELFYEHVFPLTEDDIQYIPPPIHANSVFQQVFVCSPIRSVARASLRSGAASIITCVTKHSGIKRLSMK